MWSTLIVCLTILALFQWFLGPIAQELLGISRLKIERDAEPPRPQEAVSIPPDLYALAQSYEDEWARDQAMQKMRELYGDTSNWDLVRVSYGLSQRESK